MESDALFTQKIYLTPGELNKVKIDKLDSIILVKLKETLEDKCSEHGYVVKDSINIVSRSLGEIENARFTGDFIFTVRAYGRVINAGEGIKISGRVVRKNKMGVLVDFKNAIQVQLPRDLHIGDPDFDKIEIGDNINVELRRSQFQIKDRYILANGIFKGTENTELYKDGIQMDRLMEEQHKTKEIAPVAKSTVAEAGEGGDAEGDEGTEGEEGTEAGGDAEGEEGTEGEAGTEGEVVVEE